MLAAQHRYQPLRQCQLPPTAPHPPLHAAHLPPLPAPHQPPALLSPQLPPPQQRRPAVSHHLLLLLLLAPSAPQLQLLAPPLRRRLLPLPPPLPGLQPVLQRWRAAATPSAGLAPPLPQQEAAG